MAHEKVHVICENLCLEEGMTKEQIEAAINVEETARKAEVAVERARINSIASLPEGSTSGDAEVIDARVGNDGTIYKNLGTAIRSQINEVVQGQKKIVSSINDLTDFNNAALNRIIIVNVATGIANMPEEQKGTLITLSQSSSYNFGGTIQFYITSNAHFYFRNRMYNSGGPWTDWVALWTNYSMNLKTIIAEKDTFDDSSSLSDFNDALLNHIYNINATGISNQPQNKKGTLFCLSVGSTYVKGGRVQLHYAEDGNVYYRTTLYKGEIIWTEWKRFSFFEEVKPVDYFNSNSVTIFNKILCIGDSTTHGACNYRQDGSTSPNIPFPNYAYPTQLKKMTGVDTSNYGWSGITTPGWLTRYNDTDLSGHDCVILALGINDYSKGVTLQESDTALRSIITKLKNENKGIKIFISSIFACYYKRATGEQLNYYNSLNTARKNLCDELDDCYFVDMSNLSKAYGSNYTQGHPTALGYNKMATELKNYISYIVDNNPSEFKNVQFIGTDYEY